MQASKDKIARTAAFIRELRVRSAGLWYLRVEAVRFIDGSYSSFIAWKNEASFSWDGAITALEAGDLPTAQRALERAYNLAEVCRLDTIFERAALFLITSLID